MQQLCTLMVISIFCVLSWFLPPPEGLTADGYHSALLFFTTIILIVTNPPPRTLTLLILTLYLLVRLLIPTSVTAIQATITDFSSPVTWLIFNSLMLARAFAKTGLGKRIALLLLSRFGQSTLRSAYCLGVADFILAPATASNTARAAIIAPIADALAKTINPNDQRLGKFLISSVSAMNDASAVAFSTSFAGNLVFVGIVLSITGVAVSFSQWALFLLPPALFLLLIIPYLLYRFIQPETQRTPEVPRYSRQELAKMGAPTVFEWRLLWVFLGLILLWSLGSLLNLSVTTVAFGGLAALLLLKVLQLKDLMGNAVSFYPLLWFSALMGMADNLKKTGFTDWLGGHITSFINSHFGDLNSTILLLVVMALYLFTSYLFASGTAKVVALAPVILGLLIPLGVPSEVAIFSFAAVTNLGCNLAAYTHARNPLLISMGHHNSQEWMKIGLVIGVSGFVIVMGLGLTWWQLLLD